jgi:TnsA endonuclease N terminal
MAVRRLKKSHQNVTGRFYSTLLNRLVQFDSLLERDFILLLDMHPVVRWFAEQPLKIRMCHEGGGEKFYVPDFLVEFHGGRFLGRKALRPWIVETKCSSDLRENWSKLRPKFRAGVREARKRDCLFRIVTDSRLLTADLANARFLRRYLNVDITPDAIESVVRTVRMTGRTTIGNLSSETMAPVEQVDPAVWVAIAKRLIAAEFGKPFGPETMVWAR